MILNPTVPRLRVCDVWFPPGVRSMALAYALTEPLRQTAPTGKRHMVGKGVGRRSREVMPVCLSRIETHGPPIWLRPGSGQGDQGARRVVHYP